MNATESKRAAMYERIEQHGRQLLAIFPDATERDPVKLCKTLRRLEAQANRAATDCCNGDMTYEEWEQQSGDMLRKLSAILGDTSTPIFVNGDPRGYALKIDDEWMRTNNADLHRDWGGYGIIAPDLT